MRRVELLDGLPDGFVDELHQGAKLRRAAVVSALDQSDAQRREDDNHFVYKFIHTAVIATLMAMWDDPDGELVVWRVIEIPHHVASLPGDADTILEAWKDWILMPDAHPERGLFAIFSVPMAPVITGVPIFRPTDNTYHHRLNDFLLRDADRFQEAATEVERRYEQHQSLQREGRMANLLVSLLDERGDADAEGTATTL